MTKRTTIPPYERARRRSGHRGKEDPRHVTAVSELLGKAIKEARVARGLTQEDLAILIDGSRSIIQQYERGDRTPSTIAMLRIAKACQTSMSSIYSAVDDYRLPPPPELPPKPPAPKPVRKWT